MSYEQQAQRLLVESFRRQVDNWLTIERYWRGVPADVVTHPPIALELHKAVVHRARHCAEYADVLRHMLEYGDQEMVNAYAAALRDMDSRHGGRDS